MIVERPLDLVVALTYDLEALTGISLNRDRSTIQSRFHHEGLPFLTKTLPAFGDSFFRSLKVGAIQHPSAFKRKGALPAFLSGLTSRVFSRDTGSLLEDPCYVAAFCIRQLSYLLYKYEVAYSPEQELAAYQKVIETDRALDGSVCIDPFDKVLLVAESLISDIFEGVSLRNFTPRHGPGAVNRGGVTPWSKYDFEGMPLFELFEDDYFVATPGTFSDVAPGISALSSEVHHWSPAQAGTADVSKVSAVPKNSKGPRIISGEHEARMWLQLGFGGLIVDTLERHFMTKGQFNFKDQSVNARLALFGSRTGALATLDMSEASDRISCKLCAHLLPTRMYRILMDLRSPYTQFPHLDSPIELAKMAPMGNGFCFPLESLVFWALAVSSIAVQVEPVITTENGIRAACRAVHVYGDDLIVPTEHAECLMADLERYGFRFNRDKSFWTGPFRESCGTDAFLGVDITPLKIKKVIPRSKSDVSEIIGWLDASCEWASLLPCLANAMSETCYHALRCKPTYPENWAGGIGTPLPFSELKGKVVKRGDIIRRGRIKKRLPGGGVWLESPHSLAPSDGKMVKVLEKSTNTVYPPECEFPDSSRYLRALNRTAPAYSYKNRSVVPEATGDNRSFALRYSTNLVWTRKFVA